MTRIARSRRPGTRPCVRVIWVASRLTRVAVVAQEGELPALPRAPLEAQDLLRAPLRVLAVLLQVAVLLRLLVPLALLALLPLVVAVAVEVALHRSLSA